MAPIPEAAYPFADVTVIGSGLAGMAASIHLAKAGLEVLCIGPDPSMTHPVGESLDWSAPDLLAAIGLPMERLIAEGIATYKQHVTLKQENGPERHYIPGDWLGRPPFNLELRTMHVDRTRLNAALRKIFLSHGVELLNDRIVDIETRGDRVSAATTAQGLRIATRWFLDASGSAASLLPRTFKLPAIDYGPSKVAMWSYFKVDESVEGTSLYANGVKLPYMEWIWEIPVQPDTISVGYVAAASTIKEKRRQGQSVEEIFREQLGHFSRFTELLRNAELVTPRVTSFRCRVHRKVAGPNWLVIGESAAMVDPMTSNGVTAALRHADEASRLILRARHRSKLPLLGRAMYSRRVEGLARFFNSGIEKVIYDWPIRNHIGVLNAGDVYTVPAWSLNSIYARLRPRGVFSTLLFGAALSFFRGCASIYSSFCRQREVSCEAEA
jgi:flavin-dependent dehydrogenase